MNTYNKLREHIYSKLYHEETGYYLNYMFLTIKEPAIWQETRAHCVKQYKLASLPLIFTVFVYLGLHCFEYFRHSSGHPVQLIGSAVNCVLIVTLLALEKAYPKSRLLQDYTSSVIGAIFLSVHVTTTVCVYKGWVPEVWRDIPKEPFQMTIVLIFMFVNATPVQDFKVTLFFSAPLFLTGMYLQMSVLNQIHAVEVTELSHLNYFQPQQGWLYKKFFGYFGIAFLFCYSHYIQQLDLKRTIIQKYIEKQQ